MVGNLPATSTAARTDRAGGEGRKRLTGLGHWAARSALIVSTMARNSRQASWQARPAARLNELYETLMKRARTRARRARPLSP